MDIKTLSIGGLALAALAVALSKGGETTKMVAGPTAADVVVTDIAATGSEAPIKTCERRWTKVDDHPLALRWLCDGAYLHGAQDWLDEIAGADGVQVALRPEATAKGVQYKAAVTRGPLPVRP